MKVVILEPLSDEVISGLFEQAVVGRRKGDPYINGLRCFTRLLELELQAQIYNAEYRRNRSLLGNARSRARKASQLGDQPCTSAKTASTS